MLMQLKTSGTVDCKHSTFCVRHHHLHDTATTTEHTTVPQVLRLHAVSLQLCMQCAATLLLTARDVHDTIGCPRSLMLVSHWHAWL